MGRRETTSVALVVSTWVDDSPLPRPFSCAQTASKPRNPLIASALYRSGDIETYGTGLRRIRCACDAQGVPVEVFQRGCGVHARFTRAEAVAADNPPTNRRQPADSIDNRLTTDVESVSTPPKVLARAWSVLSENERAVCAYLSDGGLSTVPSMSGALGIPERTLRDVMLRLVEKGIVSATGANRNRRYELK